MTITAWDLSILDWIQGIRSPFLDQFLSAITHLGDAGIFWILLTLVLLFIPKYRKTACQMALALILTLILTNLLLKNLVARPRPCWIRDVELLIANPKDYSFPSGHTQASICSVVCLLHSHKKMGIAAFVLSVPIIFSRMYLYVHYPTDIIGGIIMGILCAMISIWGVERMAAFRKAGKAG